jgi:integrase
MATRKRGKSWQVDFMVAGQRIRETFDTHNEAEAWELETRAAIKRGQPLPPARNQRVDTGGKITTLGALLDHLLKVHWEHLPRSIKTNRINVEIVRKGLGHDLPLAEITRQRLEEFGTELLDGGNSKNTAMRKLFVISKALNYAVENGLIDRAPKVPKYKPGPGRLRWLNDDEEDKIVQTFMSWAAEDMALFTIVGSETGLRLSELLRCRWDEYTHELARLTVWITKNDKPRTIRITRRCRTALLRLKALYPEGRGPFAHFTKFESHQRELWDRMRTHLKFDDVVIHTLRHTCASRMVQAGISLQKVMEHMGHSDIKMTLRYAHLAPDSMDDVVTVMDNRQRLKAVS